MNYLFLTVEMCCIFVCLFVFVCVQLSINMILVIVIKLLIYSNTVSPSSRCFFFCSFVNGYFCLRQSLHFLIHCKLSQKFLTCILYINHIFQTKVLEVNILFFGSQICFGNVYFQKIIEIIVLHVLGSSKSLQIMKRGSNIVFSDIIF